MQSSLASSLTETNPAPRVGNVPDAIRQTAAWALFEEGGLATSYTCMDADEATDIAADVFNIQGKLTRFATEKDDTFRVDASDGKRYVLKIANPHEPIDEIDLQLQVLQHIHRAQPGLPVPRVLRNKACATLSTFTDRAGQIRHARLLSFVDGTPLDSVESTAAEREQVGEILARLRLATADFSHPADSRSLAWDVKHLPTLTPLLQGVGDATQRTLLEQGLSRFASIQPRIAGLRSQVLHNDFSRSNIVVQAGHPDFVTGIIDFGDIVRTAIAIDVSTALLNQLPSGDAVRMENDIFMNGRDLLRGYLRIADLTDEELSLLPYLTMGRVITRALLTTWRARMFPDNATYILRNTQQGWAQLKWFLSRSDTQLSELLLNSGSSSTPNSRSFL